MIELLLRKIVILVKMMKKIKNHLKIIVNKNKIHVIQDNKIMIINNNIKMQKINIMINNDKRKIIIHLEKIIHQEIIINIIIMNREEVDQEIDKEIIIMLIMIGIKNHMMIEKEIIIKKILVVQEEDNNKIEMLVKIENKN